MNPNDPSNPLVDKLFDQNWPIRRAVMFIALLFMGGNAQWIIIRNSDSVLHQQALVALLGAITTIIVGYVFGAVMDDRAKRAQLMQMPGASPYGSNPPYSAGGRLPSIYDDPGVPYRPPSAQSSGGINYGPPDYGRSKPAQGQINAQKAQ